MVHSEGGQYLFRLIPTICRYLQCLFANMNLLTISRSRPTVVVGLDFGTSFSGFAFALTSNPDEMHKFYEWPDLGAAGGGHYCKTLTSLLYETEELSGSEYVLQDWGYSALLKHTRGLIRSRRHQISYGEDVDGPVNRLASLPANGADTRKRTFYLTMFKLHLVRSESARPAVADLPVGLTPRRVISDYLRKLSDLIMTEVQSRVGTHISMEDVRWCLTVPAIWDDRSKQEMKICASMAGMTRGPDCPLDSMDTASPHPVMIVLEPEAASLYCQRKVQFSLSRGDKFLIVDVGGGTVDLVLHEKIGSGTSDLKVREVSPSSGGLFGGSFVDQAFFDFLSNKISCFQAFARTNSDSVLKLKGWWETIKCSFDGSEHFFVELELPARLARAWETDEESNNRFSNVTGCYDAIELCFDDMVKLFDPVVDGILGLIESKMMDGLKAMVIVGGFSGSPYLVKRIREEFSARVGTIVVPDEPGAAVCCGAVQYGIYGADVIMSRMSKKTYGIQTSRPFYLTDLPNLMFQDDDGESFCKEVFSIYTTKNEEVPLDHRVSRTFVPFTKSQTEMSVSLFSTSELNPKYVCDPGVTKEGNFLLTIPSENELGQVPKVLISMYFGRTVIEVEVEGQNFGNGEKFKMGPVRFEKAFE